MSSASMSAKVMSVTPQGGAREQVPELTDEELLRAAHAYWPEVDDETKVVPVMWGTYAAVTPHGLEIEIIELSRFRMNGQVIDLGYGPRSNTLAVRR
jgi:hypothetical protein